jgi:hypothetical protein
MGFTPMAGFQPLSTPPATELITRNPDERIPCTRMTPAERMSAREARRQAHFLFDSESLQPQLSY